MSFQRVHETGIRRRDFAGLLRCRRFVCFVAFTGASLALSQSSLAGGDYGEIRLTDFSAKPDGEMQFEFTATIVDAWSDVSDCTQIVVSGRYDSERWQKYVRPMSVATHASSLVALRESLESGAAIHFGTMGAGLKRAGDCRYESKGLFVEEHLNDSVVFSVHYPI